MEALVRSVAAYGTLLIVIGFSSCVAPPPIRGDVEDVERGAPVTDVPHTSDQEYIRAGERYANPYSDRHYYHRGYGYPHGGWRY